MITKTNQALSDIFDVEPVTHAIIEHEPVKATVESAHDTDFEIARLTMHNMLIKGQEAVGNALIIANGTEEADSYNALSTLIKTMTDASSKLMGLHEIRAKIVKPVTQSTPQIEATNNTTISGPVVFVGSTSELASAISSNRKLYNTPHL